MFEINQKTLVTLKPSCTTLSIPSWEALQDSKKRKGMVRHGHLDEMIDYVGADVKHPYVCHLEHYLNSVGDATGQQPRSILVWGVRNILNNLGTLVYSRNHPGRLLYRVDEPIQHWTYQGLTKFEDGSLSIEAFRCHPERSGYELIDLLGNAAGREEEVEFIVTGQPLLWDGQVMPQELLAALTYDQRHIFHLLWEAWTRKKWPEFDWHKQAHNELMDLFMACLQEPVDVRAQKLCAVARRWGLDFETGYLMSGIGLRNDGTIVLVKQHGIMSQIGVELRKLGCIRGILNHQGGSVGALYWSKSEWKQKGWRRDGTGVQPLYLGQGTYFRPRGIATLIAELENDPIEPPFRPTIASVLLGR